MKIKKLIYRLYEKSLWNQIKNDQKPHHIGVILDGNRRYAREKGMDGTEGHSFGADKVEELLKWCSKLDIKIVTLFAFSTENFNRSKEEVSMLMGLLTKTLKKLQTDPLVKENKIRVRVIGKLEYLSEDMNKEITKIEEQTKDNDSFLLNIAISYGGRTEIVDAVKKVAESVKKGDLAIEDINEDVLAENLYTKGIPDPDLVIRTSGEERLSGFLLWQSAYSELYFTEVYWPAFRMIDLWRAIRIYQQRQRRYGK